jgi:hypothetical protein
LKKVIAPLEEREEKTHYPQQHWVSLLEKKSIKKNSIMTMGWMLA